ncbi:MAG: glycosyltransferase family 4 protein [Minisyncoccia bacterium]
MKRILTFSLAYLPYLGGAELAIQQLTDRIPDIEFHLVTLRFDSSWPKEEKIGNILVHRVGWGKRHTVASATFTPRFYFSKVFFVPLAAAEGLRLHRANHFDGAWAMMSYMVFPIVLMRALGARLPYAVTLQEGDTFERTFGRARIALFAPLLTYGFRRASAVQAISRFLGEWARARGFEGPVEIIPNGVDGKKFSRGISAEERSALRKKYSLRESDTVLFTASRLVHKNGVDLVIRALSALPFEVKFLIAGSGPERVALEVLVQELKLERRVVVAAQIDNAELPAHLHASDIFIRASRSEGQGIAFIEAMAAGLPVVAPLVGGIRDFLFDAVKNPGQEPTGFAVEPESPQSIAEVVQTILADQKAAARVAHRAQEMVLLNYDWDDLAKKMCDRVFAKLGHA